MAVRANARAESRLFLFQKRHVHYAAAVDWGRRIRPEFSDCRTVPRCASRMPRLTDVISWRSRPFCYRQGGASIQARLAPILQLYCALNYQPTGG
jgi:hypothetical protein